MLLIFLAEKWAPGRPREMPLQTNITSGSQNTAIRQKAPVYLQPGIQ